MLDRMSPKDPNEIDQLVGSRVQQRRMLIDLSQEHLAKALGITVPQLQKYEKGVNRISASRLHKLAGVLDVPIGYFFEAHTGAGPSKTGPGEAEEPVEPDPSVFADRETIALAMAFSRITRPEARHALLALARAAARLDRAAPDASAGEASA
jgi:transcriptional regulator with XRE-family HTH domain